ncbi:phage tail tape measure protein [Alkalibacillus almallahensis]|uniref:phage tail tape measure protein n=1 Tax=Alkalibacillus almallahensis TaxID=1379154 RepID=UPI001423596F|nr:phage tail tape measure protein [Alkalibacillus almallahensis]NIK10927.1 TP901 family phage tail tape measure protein [Alkalibacillus almallahensis]
MAEVGALRTKISLDSAQFQQSIQSVNRQLKSLKQEQKAVTSSGTGFARGVDELRGKQDVLNRTLEVQQQQVRTLKRRYEESRKATGDNSKETQNARTAYNKALGEMNKTEEQLKGITSELERQQNPWLQLEKRMDSYGQSLQNRGRQITSFGRTMSMGVTTPLLGAAGAALKVGMDFEEGMSQVQAVSGSTNEEMEKLEDQAKEFGSTTRFSATEAASGMEFLGRAGFETNEILDSMPGLLDLAASGNMELGQAANIASNIISGFNMKASEAGRVSDALAATAASANTDVNGLGQAMANVAPVAADLDINFESLSAAVGTMADAGIEGSRSGRMLRQGILRLSDPTGEAASLMEDLNLNIFDAEGNMRDFPDVVGELEGAFSDMESEARTAAMATIFGAESTAGWSALLNRGADDLSDYTDELQNSEGAAADMAETMEDNGKGALREFRSAAEGAGIEIAEHLLPPVTDLIEQGTDLARKFGELEDDTQKNIIKMGAFAAAIGPAALVAGNLTTAIGGIVRTGGSLAGVLGRSSGAGLLGRIGAMGMGGPVGLAVGGVGALAAGVYTLKKRSEDANEVSLETIDSKLKEKEANDELIDKYEDLQRQSQLSQDEFERYIDLNSRLGEAESDKEISNIKDEMEELREKSGFSNDQLDDMVGLNETLVEKLPGATDEITEQGERVAGSADEMREYNDQLRELATRELEQKMLDQLNEYQETTQEIANLEKEKELSLEYEEELRQRLKELSDKSFEGLKEELTNENEKLESMRQQTDISDAELENVNQRLELNEDMLAFLREEGEISHEQYNLLNNQLSEQMKHTDEVNNTIEEREKERDKVNEVIARLSEQRLVNAGISEEVANQAVENGNIEEIIGNQISKLEEEKQKMIENAGPAERMTQEFQDGVSEIDNQILNLQTAEDKIYDMIGTAEGYNSELAKDIQKDLGLTSTPTIPEFRQELMNPLGVTVEPQIQGLAAFRQRLTMPLQARVNPISPQYAKGTDYHPGGPAIVGEEGWELARHGNQWTALNAGMYDLPRGTEVFTHQESKRMIDAMNNIPGYASGVSAPGEANRVVNSLNNQSMQGEAVVYTTVINQMDGREVGRQTYKHITEFQNREQRVRDEFA